MRAYFFGQNTWDSQYIYLLIFFIVWFKFLLFRYFSIGNAFKNLNHETSLTGGFVISVFEGLFFRTKYTGQSVYLPSETPTLLWEKPAIISSFQPFLSKATWNSESTDGENIKNLDIKEMIARDIEILSIGDFQIVYLDWRPVF